MFAVLFSCRDVARWRMEKAQVFLIQIKFVDIKQTASPLCKCDMLACSSASIQKS